MYIIHLVATRIEQKTGPRVVCSFFFRWICHERFVRCNFWSLAGGRQHESHFGITVYAF